MFRIKAPPPSAAASAVAAATSTTTTTNGTGGNYFFLRKLQYLCHNARSFQRFGAANGEVLANYLLHHFPLHAEAIRTNKAPSLTSHDLQRHGITKSNLSISDMLPPIHEQYFVAKDYVEGVLGSTISPNAPPPCVLPLPEVTHLHQQLLNGTLTAAEIEEMLQPRELYHISSVVGYEHYDWSKYAIDNTLSLIGNRIKKAEEAAAIDEASRQALIDEDVTDFLKNRLSLKKPTEYNTGTFKVHLPRDAQTGNFYQREELVDNLLAASRHFGYQNPFWLRNGHHPQLHKYLKLAAPGSSASAGLGGATIGSSVDALAHGGAAPNGTDYESYAAQVPCVTVGLSSVVFFLEDLQPKFPVAFLHPLLRPDASSPHVAGKQLSTCYDLLTRKGQIQRGMNAATGFVSKNPYFREGEGGGVLSGRAKSPSGVWLSLDQVQRYGLTLKDGSVPVLLPQPTTTPTAAAATDSSDKAEPAPTAAGKKPKKEKKEKAEKKPKKGKKGAEASAEEPPANSSKSSTTTSSSPFSQRHQQWTGNGRLIEIDEWELYNAAQLAVPGRVGLKAAINDENAPKTGLFQ